MTGWTRCLQLGFALYACSAFVACFQPDGSGGFASPDAGDTGAGGTGGGDGGVGVDPDQPLACPLMECPPPDPNPMLAGIFEVCCAPSGRCSLRSPGTECIELPEPDPRCGTLFVGKSELPGCCVDGVTCSVNLDTIGLGCVPPDLLASVGIMLEQRACAASAPVDDAGHDSDAGL